MQTWGTIDAFLLTHELDAPNEHCPDLWVSLVASVRAAFSGAVSAAMSTPVLQPSINALEPWLDSLDFVGIECYFQVRASSMR